MDALRDILTKLPAGGTDLPRATAVALAWTLAAGPELAARVRRVELEHGVLQLQAESPAAARQIASVAVEVRKEMNKMLGAERVQRVRCSL